MNPLTALRLAALAAKLRALRPAIEAAWAALRRVITATADALRRLRPYLERWGLLEPVESDAAEPPEMVDPWEPARLRVVPVPRYPSGAAVPVQAWPVTEREAAVHLEHEHGQPFTGRADLMDLDGNPVTSPIGAHLTLTHAGLAHTHPGAEALDAGSEAGA